MKPRLLKYSQHLKNHAVLNNEMQRIFDERTTEDYIDKDDTDASHFYLSGDDGTQHWWII